MLPVNLEFDEVTEALKQAWKEKRLAVQNPEAVETTDCLYWYETIEKKRVGCAIGVALPEELLILLSDSCLLGSPISGLVKSDWVVVDDLEKFKQLQQCHDLSLDSLDIPPEDMFKQKLASHFPEIVLEEV